MVFIVHARNIIGPAICNTNNVSKKNSPLRLSEFSPNSLEFLIKISHAYYTFTFTLNYRILLSFLQL